MPLYINTNVTSLNSQRQLLKSSNALGKTFARLSSGLRINSAKDDAAGMAITQRMTSQIRGLNQAVRNANDGISLAQVAEGALDESTNSLQRIRELAVQAANSTYGDTDRLYLQKEIDQLLSEMQRISQQTSFNGQLLLNGDYRTGRNFQVGVFASHRLAISIHAASLGALMSVPGGFVGQMDRTTGRVVNETAAGTSWGGHMSNLGICRVTTSAKALATMDQVDKALDSIATIRANLGAIQSRFDAVVANLSNMSENMSASRSRIQDADIAAETAELTRNAILQQAGTAILAQANQQPQLALQLLGSR
ncbi:MAG: flagellin FliC [Magnetococcales bacterium]|nr:flagellin FliC [Magnetococcales bacterium]